MYYLLLCKESVPCERKTALTNDFNKWRLVYLYIVYSKSIRVLILLSAVSTLSLNFISDFCFPFKLLGLFQWTRIIVHSVCSLRVTHINVRRLSTDLIQLKNSTHRYYGFKMNVINATFVFLLFFLLHSLCNRMFFNKEL